MENFLGTVNKTLICLSKQKLSSLYIKHVWNHFMYCELGPVLEKCKSNLHYYTTAMIFRVKSLVELKLSLLSPFTIMPLKTFLLHDLNKRVKEIRRWDTEQIGQTATIQNAFSLLNFTLSKRRTERR